MPRQSISEIRAIVTKATLDSIDVVEREYRDDEREGVKRLLASARRRLEREAAERTRLEGLYSNDIEIARSHAAKVVVGLDEVGRGCMAGPLAVGAVVLDYSTRIEALNDSKQIKPEVREKVATKITSTSRAWAVKYVEPSSIDAQGITASLISAFRDAVADIESQGFAVDLILLDGNPLRFDDRELNVIKGDSKCACIAAASVIAKVSRDAHMSVAAKSYPEYLFERNKGYGTLEHRQAIAEHGLCELHRKSFCAEFLQDSLF